MSDDARLDPRFIAGVKLIERTGATSFRVGWNDEDEPIVWFACAAYKKGGEAAAALDPLTAVMRLCEALIDGGKCTHCERPSIFVADTPEGSIGDMLLDHIGCVYSYDPELQTFRRECEGG